jgi:hypothetical protein
VGSRAVVLSGSGSPARESQYRNLGGDFLQTRHRQPAGRAAITTADAASARQTVFGIIGRISGMRKPSG